jgi:peptide/nickel transport system ATP-binding protein
MVHLSLDKQAARKRAANLLEELGLPGGASRMSDYPHQFSGGMQQRLAIAMALIHEPDHLIADEPTTALDVTTQAQILALLDREAKKHNIALLFVTHDLALVSPLCDRVVVMYGGRVLEEGPVADILRRPLNPYTRALIDTAAALEGDQSSDLPILQGAPPRSGQDAPGCPFSPRCPQAAADRATDMPAAKGIDHKVSCFHPLELGQVQ